MIKNTPNNTSIAGSFRDPSGFVFLRDGVIYRQINNSCQKDYDQLMSSGLYQKLVQKKLIIPHKETSLDFVKTADCYKIIQPERIPFISYPYEWGFGQLKSAALCTLDIQAQALKFNMSLKDASAYNIQFFKGRPLLIDTLSFEKYQPGSPWIAYRQFCQHFLSPLALMAYTDIRLGGLSRSFIDGIPLDLASFLLPFKSKFKLSLLLHIHLHAKSQKHYANKTLKNKQPQMTARSLLGLLNSLEKTIEQLNWKLPESEWGEYYSETNYSRLAFDERKGISAGFVDQARPKSVWDLGANTGVFSRLASERGINTIAFDFDYAAIEKNYLNIIKNKEQNILPLFLDLTNPSPAIGWANEERLSLKERGPAGLIIALALIHHLAISNNLPLDHIAGFFEKLGQSLIIEFIPKTDSNVKRLLATREDIFKNYNQENFEHEFSKFFNIQKKINIKNSARTLYLMAKRK